MAHTHLLGFPRIGAQRELKFALESFWRGESDAAQLHGTAAALRRHHWALQRDAGLTHVVAGDFSLYDGMLDLSVLLGALPARFGFDAKALTPAQYFELARGNAAQPATEMTKWFDTNYHYLVPELAPDTRFDGGRDDWFEQIRDAQLSARIALQAQQVALGLADPREHLARQREQPLAGGGEGHALARRALEQRDRVMALQRADLVRQRRLAQVHALGRGGELAVLGDGQQ